MPGCIKAGHIYLFKFPAKIAGFKNQLFYFRSRDIFRNDPQDVIAVMQVHIPFQDTGMMV